MKQPYISFNPSLSEHWMAQAYEIACSAGHSDEVPVGALLVYGPEIIGIGANRRETSKRVVAHAEIMALEDYSRRTGEWRVPQGTSLYVTIEPCLMCTGAMLWARVDNLYFGCADSKNAGVEKILGLIHRGTYDHRFRDVRGGILGDRCSRLISSYFRSKRRKSPENPLEMNQ